MAEANKSGLYTLTAPAILAHPNLFVPRPFGPKGKETGEPKYSGNFVLRADHPDLAPLKALAIQVAKEQWPGRDIKELALPFSSGTKLADKRAAERRAAGKEPDGEYQRGCAVLAARSKFQPQLAFLENGKLVDVGDDEALKAMAKKKFFFGAEVLAQFNFNAYKGVGRNPDGVNIYLQSVFATGKGTRIGGTERSAAEVFKGYAGSVSMEDPTAGDTAGLPESW